jgi:hypothetical protein
MAGIRRNGNGKYGGTHELSRPPDKEAWEGLRAVRSFCEQANLSALAEAATCPALVRFLVYEEGKPDDGLPGEDRTARQTTTGRRADEIDRGIASSR